LRLRFRDGSACDLLSVGWYGHANAVLSQEARAWMAGLPDLISFEHAGNRYAVLHGGLTDVARFIWPTTPPEVFAEEWERVEAATGPVDHIIAGHSGIPFVRDLPQGRWINAGVIGMPPHDGLSETRYAILDRGRIEICHLSYDVLAAADEMSGITRLPKGYRDALLTGYWPSEDVLPPELRVPALASG
jgi:predicted phosphodiesterase